MLKGLCRKLLKTVHVKYDMLFAVAIILFLCVYSNLWDGLDLNGSCSLGSGKPKGSPPPNPFWMLCP